MLLIHLFGLFLFVVDVGQKWFSALMSYCYSSKHSFENCFSFVVSSLFFFFAREKYHRVGTTLLWHTDKCLRISAKKRCTRKHMQNFTYTQHTCILCGRLFLTAKYWTYIKKNSEKMHHESKMNAKECALSREKEEEFSAANCIII